MAKILETTLRDGSYLIDFQVTSRDTREIASALENFGFEFIEVGHGVGLNASNSGKGKAAVSDEEYMKAAASALKIAKWGMFFIPGIGRYEDIDMAADYHMDFIRIGTNINESEDGFKFIEYAKKKGMFVSSNLMKSYAVSPDEFAQRARMGCEAGADMVCLVDSAGGMLPEDVENYFIAAQKTTNVKLGFHGHDNLRMAVANSLKAVECGAYIVDTSLQGLGRGGGNAATEILVSILLKKGLFKDCDLYAILDFSNNFIKPYLREKGIDGVTLISGHAMFHSSFFPLVKKYAERYNIDPRELIVELCKIDVVSAPESLMDVVAQHLTKKSYKGHPRQVFNRKLYEIDRQDKKISLKKEVAAVVKEITVLASKYNKLGVFNIVTPIIHRKKTAISRFIQESPSFVIGSCEIANKKDLSVILDVIDSKIDIVFYDAERKPLFSSEMLNLVKGKVKHSILLFYRDMDVWAKAIENLVVQLSGDMVKKILLVGNSPLTPILLLNLSSLGYQVFVWNHKESIPMRANTNNLPLSQHKKNVWGKMDLIVGVEPLTEVVNEQFIGMIKPNGVIIDGGIGSISRKVTDYAMKKSIKIIRTDMRGALDAEIRGKLNTHELVFQVLGKKKIGGIECVAGGIYGKKNSVVLDSIKNPQCILGIADGRGRVKYVLTDKENALVKKVEKALFSL